MPEQNPTIETRFGLIHITTPDSGAVARESGVLSQTIYDLLVALILDEKQTKSSSNSST